MTPARRWLTCHLSALACLLMVYGCGVFHVGLTSRQGAEVLEAAPKPAPVDSEFEGCGPDGSQPDYALNRRKNRIDEGEYAVSKSDIGPGQSRRIGASPQ